MWPLVAQGGANERRPGPLGPECSFAKQVREEKEPVRTGLHLGRLLGEAVESAAYETRVAGVLQNWSTEPPEGDAGGVCDAETGPIAAG